MTGCIYVFGCYSVRAGDQCGNIRSTSSSSHCLFCEAHNPKEPHTTEEIYVLKLLVMRALEGGANWVHPEYVREIADNYQTKTFLKSLGVPIAEDDPASEESESEESESESESEAEENSNSGDGSEEEMNEEELREFVEGNDKLMDLLEALQRQESKD